MTYARFTIDTTAFEFPPDTHVGPGRMAFEHFLRFWQEYGIFVSLGKIPLRDSLPEDLRKKYNEVFKRMQYSANRVEFSEINFDSIVGDITNGSAKSLTVLKLRVIGLFDGLYEDLRPRAQDISFRTKAREEVCRIRDLLLTETRKQLDLLRAADVPVDLPVDQIWHEKFLPLFQANNLICVVDPYALVNFSKGSDPMDTGLGYLLNQLTKGSTQIGHVEIITSLRRDRRATTDPVERLSAYCKKIGVRNAAIYVNSQQTSERLMHDRFMIGTDHTIDIGRGLDVLSSPPRSQPIAFAFKPMTDERSRIYHMLRNARRDMLSINLP